MRSTFNHIASTFMILFSITACLDATIYEGNPPRWPQQWYSSVALQEQNSDGSSGKTSSGNVFYDWDSLAMRISHMAAFSSNSDSVPAPLDKTGSMLMQDGKIYYEHIDGSCSCSPPNSIQQIPFSHSFMTPTSTSSYTTFGAPRPTWLEDTNAQFVKFIDCPDDSNETCSVWKVNLNKYKEPDFSGCFIYIERLERLLFLDIDEYIEISQPVAFGGSTTCADYPAGSYLYYGAVNYGPPIDFVPDVFTAPNSACTNSCQLPDTSQQNTGCYHCHDFKPH